MDHSVERLELKQAIAALLQQHEENTGDVVSDLGLTNNGRCHGEIEVKHIDLRVNGNVGTIHWDRAPKGTTHLDVFGTENRWLRNVDGLWWYWVDRYGYWDAWRPEAEQIQTFYARPE